MSINLSAAELNNGDLVENVAKAITAPASAPPR